MTAVAVPSWPEAGVDPKVVVAGLLCPKSPPVEPNAPPVLEDPNTPVPVAGAVVVEPKAPVPLPNALVPPPPNAPKPEVGLGAPKAEDVVAGCVAGWPNPLNADVPVLGVPRFPNIGFAVCGCWGCPKVPFEPKAPPVPKAPGWPKADPCGCGCCCWFCCWFDHNDWTWFVPNILQRRRRDVSSSLQAFSTMTKLTKRGPSKFNLRRWAY